jgi:hypothetical protein
MEPDDFRQWTATCYAGAATALHLWDISDADISQFSFKDIEEGAIHTKRVSGLRRGGKTASITPKDRDFDINRMCETFSEIAIGAIEYPMFRTREDANAWLGICDEPG